MSGEKYWIKELFSGRPLEKAASCLLAAQSCHSSLGLPRYTPSKFPPATRYIKTKHSKYIWQFRQIYFAIWKHTFCIWTICFPIWSNTLSNLDKYTWTWTWTCMTGRHKDLVYKGSHRRPFCLFFLTLFKRGGEGQTHIKKFCCKFCIILKGFLAT